MTRNKTSTLIFSAVRKMARLQRTAWGLAPHVLFKEIVGTPKRAKAAKVAKAKPVKASPSPGRAAADAKPEFDPAKFAGTWKTRMYRTPPAPGVWPVRLSYFVYTPPRLRKGCPVLVMLHGCEQTAKDFAVGTRMHRLADREGVLLVYPQQSRRGQQNRCWHWYQPDAAHGYAEADAIAGIAAAAVEDYQADPARVYIAGLSAGADMAALAALRHPHRFAALGMHSGAVLGSAHNAGQGLRVMRHGSSLPPDEAMAPFVPERAAFPGMPAIILQGDDDAVVHRRNGRQLLAQLAWVNGLAGTFDGDLDGAAAPQEKGAGSARHHVRIDAPARRGPVVSLCEVPGLGHAWSGGDGRVRFHAKLGPDASRMMWQFFKTRRRPA